MSREKLVGREKLANTKVKVFCVFANMETTLPKLSRIFIVLALLVAPTLASPWIVGRVHELQTLDELLVELDRPSHDLVLCVYKPRPQRERQLDSTLRRLASLLAGAALARSAVGSAAR